MVTDGRTTKVGRFNVKSVGHFLEIVIAYDTSRDHQIKL